MVQSLITESSEHGTTSTYTEFLIWYIQIHKILNMVECLIITRTHHASIPSQS